MGVLDDLTISTEVRKHVVLFQNIYFGRNYKKILRPYYVVTFINT